MARERQRWADRYAAFVGSAPPIALPVTVWQDGRGISSRESAPSFVIANTIAAPLAAQHNALILTPTSSMGACLRVMELLAASAAFTFGVVARPTVVSAATLVALQQDQGLEVTIESAVIAAASLPATTFVWNFATQAIYPEYLAEIAITPGNVLAIVQGDAETSVTWTMRAFTPKGAL